NAADGRRAFFWAWLFGVGKYATGTSWIYVSIHVHGQAPMPLALMLVAAFVGGMAVFSGVYGWCWFHMRAGRPLIDVMSFVSIWVLGEWLLTWFLSGFPWLFAGYALLDTPLASLAPLGGVLLVSFVGLLSGLFVFEAWKRPPLFFVAALPWVVTWLIADQTWVSPTNRLNVALVQGNVPQETKWLPESVRPILDRYASLSDSAWENDLVVWPEASVTVPYERALTYLNGLADRTEGALILGLPILESDSQKGYLQRNAAVVVGDGAGRYMKRKLVPFGEFVPFERVLRGAITFFNLPMSTMRAGAKQQALPVAAGLNVAIVICYEVVYPRLVATDAAAADIIVNISNDTWFGKSIGPMQHMQIARMRALENGRYLLRATNNGITAIVAPNGEVVSQLPQFQQGVLEGQVAAMEGVTPYSRWFDTPVILLSMFFLAVAVVVRRGNLTVEPP
ncbi:MAG: apolipoprotein N-acyltransferase, partial [Pseudomonadota bacterium]|nr:apolipoprotein N-acyltransferase [Pseudomonadota bacterium]